MTTTDWLYVDAHFSMRAEWRNSGDIPSTVNVYWTLNLDQRQIVTNAPDQSTSERPTYESTRWDRNPHDYAWSVLNDHAIDLSDWTYELTRSIEPVKGWSLDANLK